MTPPDVPALLPLTIPFLPALSPLKTPTIKSSGIATADPVPNRKKVFTPSLTLTITKFPTLSIWFTVRARISVTSI